MAREENKQIRKNKGKAISVGNGADEEGMDDNVTGLLDRSHDGLLHCTVLYHIIFCYVVVPVLFRNPYHNIVLPPGRNTV